MATYYQGSDDQSKPKNAAQLADRILNSPGQSYTIRKTHVLAMKSNNNVPRNNLMFHYPDCVQSQAYRDNIMFEVIDHCIDRTGEAPAVSESEDSMTFRM